MKRFITFGEVLLRLSPDGKEPLFHNQRLVAHFGGAEVNVGVQLAHLGHDVSIISAVPTGPIGDAAIAFLRGHGIDTRHVIRHPGRMGMYFLNPGAGLRAAHVHYDRESSAFARAPASSWNWSTMLWGQDHLHLSGITPALSTSCAEAFGQAASAASERRISVSLDVNYRPTLWEGREHLAPSMLRQAAARSNVLFANRRDIAMLTNDGSPDLEGADDRATAERAFACFDDLRLVAGTKRSWRNADSNVLSARIDDRRSAYETAEIEVAGIIDRIGTGDAFAAGVLHAVANGLSLDDIGEVGLACGALKHFVPGDVAASTAAEIAALRCGAFDVRR